MGIYSESKARLDALIQDVKSGLPDAVAAAVEFVATESYGCWHNRARAKLCRHFKNRPPRPNLCEILVKTVADRLVRGEFGQQFRDQLAMAVRLDPKRMRIAVRFASVSKLDYVRRYAAWTLHRIETTSK